MDRDVYQRETARFEISPPDDSGVHDVKARYYSGATVVHLTRAEMRDLATTLLDHLGQNYIRPDSLDAEVIRAAGAWVDEMEKPISGHPRYTPEELRGAVKDYRAGVSTK